MMTLAVPVGTLAPFVVVPLLGGLAVLCTYFVGSRLRSTAAGMVAAALLLSSPSFLFQVSQPMSDVPATAWFALARLDWPPVADIGEHVRVRVYDLSQRGAAGRLPRVDRVRAP